MPLVNKPGVATPPPTPKPDPGSSPFSAAITGVKTAASDVNALDQAIHEEAIGSVRVVLTNVIKTKLTALAQEIRTNEKPGASAVSFTDLGQANTLRSAKSSYTEQQYKSRGLETVKSLLDQKTPAFKTLVEAQVFRPLEAELKAAGMVDPKLSIVTESRYSAAHGKNINVTHIRLTGELPR
jgi:hypothetical protein